MNILNRRYREIKEEYGLIGPKEDWFARVMDFRRPYPIPPPKDSEGGEDAAQESKFESDYKGEDNDSQRNTLNSQ